MFWENPRKTPPGVKAETLRDALRRELQERAWRQKDLATALGLHESTISLWLSGRQGPRPDDKETVERLAEFLHRSPAQVRDLLALQKDAEEPRPAEGAVRTVETAGELEAVLNREMPNFYIRAVPANARVLVAGVQESLLEHGYYAEEKVVEETLRNRFEESPPGPREESVQWEPDGSALTRTPAGPGPLVRARIASAATPEELHARFRAGLRDDQVMRASVRRICDELDQAFAASGREELPHKTVRSVMSAVLRAAGENMEEAAASAILTALLRLKLIRETGTSAYRRLWPLHPEYVLNSLFGLSIGISGLDFLLDGGLLPPTETGLSILLEGRPGAGKTMFSLQMAASMASQGHLAVYLTAEEELSLLQARLSYAGCAEAGNGRPWKTMRQEGGEFSLLATNFVDGGSVNLVAERLEPGSRGVLVLASIPNREAFYSADSRMLGNLRQLLHGFSQQGAYTCFVLDSVDAVLDAEGRRPAEGRRIYEELFQVAKSPRSIGVFISEARKADDTPSLREYLTDIVIRMDYRRRRSPYSERVLEIMKCRTQSHIRGEHMLSIHSRQGITIYPSVQSLLSVWRRRVRTGDPVEVEPWNLPPDFNFEQVLQGDVVRGSTILLSGPPATHKFPVGLSFLASGLEAHPECRALLISLREDEPSVLRIIQTYPQFRSLLQPDGKAFSSRLRVLHFPPDYFTAERFLHWVRRTLREMRPSGPACRVLFHNLSQLPHNSPMFDAEPLFVDALLELFRKERVTSLFIDVGGERAQAIQHNFDTILFTARADAHGRERVTLRVSHSGPCNADRAPRVLERVYGKGGVGRLVLRDRKPA